MLFGGVEGNRELKKKNMVRKNRIKAKNRNWGKTNS